MNTSTQLFELVRDYLDRRLSLSDLEAWVASRFTVLFNPPDSIVAELASAIELSLAELNDGLIAERTIRARLKPYKHLALISFGDHPLAFTGTGTTGGRSISLTFVTQSPSPAASIGPVAVSGSV